MNAISDFSLSYPKGTNINNAKENIFTKYDDCRKFYLLHKESLHDQLTVGL